MGTREKILELVREKGPISGADIGREVGISRQAVHKHLKKLRQEGAVLKEGAKKGATFRVGTGEPQKIEEKKRCELKGLEEDRVFEEFELLLNLSTRLSEQAHDIVYYAFCEMLNNAIDHSFSTYCEIVFSLPPGRVEFDIRDHGVGLFESIRKKYNLDDETQALRELLKGKATTMPERHSGEGIFFTSRVGDRVTFRSHRIHLIFDNKKEDVFVERVPRIEGTEVHFEIARRSRRDLSEVFNEYAPEEYDFSFNRTRVHVKLYQDKYMSRSEAGRLLSRLGEFREVILDFEDVRRIGQGFADEIFRVFARNHPEVEIKTENLARELKAMIEHVIDK